MMKKARKGLTKNWGTYAMDIPRNVAGQELVKTISYKIEKNKIKRRLKKEKEDNK